MQVLTSLEPSERSMDNPPHLVRVLCGYVGEVFGLGPVPDPFIGVQFRTVWWKVDGVEAVMTFEKSFDLSASMCTQVVPDQIDLSGDLVFDLA